MPNFACYKLGWLGLLPFIFLYNSIFAGLIGDQEKIYGKDAPSSWNKLYWLLNHRCSDARLLKPEYYGTIKLEPHMFSEPMKLASNVESEWLVLLAGCRHVIGTSSQREKLYEALNACLREELPTDLLLRARFQHDLWAVFDVLWTFSSVPSYVSEPETRPVDGILAKCALLIRKVALSAEQIDALPDTFESAFKPVIDPDNKRTTYVVFHEKYNYVHEDVSGYRSSMPVCVLLKSHEGRGFLSELDSKANEIIKKPFSFRTFVLLDQLHLIDDHCRIRPTKLTVTMRVETFENSDSCFAIYSLPRRSRVSNYKNRIEPLPKQNLAGAMMDMPNPFGMFLAPILQTCKSCHGHDAFFHRSRPPNVRSPFTIRRYPTYDTTLRLAKNKANSQEFKLLTNLINRN